MEKSDIKQYREVIGRHAELTLAGKILAGMEEELSRLDRTQEAGVVEPMICSSDVVRSYVGLLVLGRTDLDEIELYRNDDSFRRALGIKQVPSSAILRHRLEANSGCLCAVAKEVWFEVVQRAFTPISAPEPAKQLEIIQRNVDAVPFDNSGSHKEGIEKPKKRVVVGRCRSCGKDLRVAEHGVKETMHLTCKCGATNTVTPPGELVQGARTLKVELASQRAKKAHAECLEVLATWKRDEAEREQKREEEEDKRRWHADQMARFTGIRNFTSWHLAANPAGPWGIICDPRDYSPPIFPVRLHAHLPIGSRVWFHECKLLYVQDETEIGEGYGLHEALGHFLVQKGDEQGLLEGIEWTLRTFHAAFWRALDNTGLELPLSRGHLLASRLAPHFADALWPD